MKWVSFWIRPSLSFALKVDKPGTITWVIGGFHGNHNLIVIFHPRKSSETSKADSTIPAAYRHKPTHNPIRKSEPWLIPNSHSWYRFFLNRFFTKKEGIALQEFDPVHPWSSEISNSITSNFFLSSISFPGFNGRTFFHKSLQLLQQHSGWKWIISATRRLFYTPLLRSSIFKYFFEFSPSLITWAVIRINSSTHSSIIRDTLLYANQWYPWSPHSSHRTVRKYD